MEEVNTDNQNTNSKPWQFQPGVSGNPAGRPKGKTMKEFAREFLLKMDDEEKVEWLKSLGKDIVWKMAEGQPAQSTDITSGGKTFIPTDEEKLKIATALENLHGSNKEDTE